MIDSWALFIIGQEGVWAGIQYPPVATARTPNDVNWPYTFGITFVQRKWQNVVHPFTLSVVFTQQQVLQCTQRVDIGGYEPNTNFYQMKFCETTNSVACFRWTQPASNLYLTIYVGKPSCIYMSVTVCYSPWVQNLHALNESVWLSAGPAVQLCWLPWGRQKQPPFGQGLIWRTAVLTPVSLCPLSSPPSPFSPAQLPAQQYIHSAGLIHRVSAVCFSLSVMCTIKLKKNKIKRTHSLPHMK